MISLPTLIWIALVVTLIVVRLIWKGIRRGVLITLIVIVGLWGIRVMQPDVWNALISIIQRAIGRLIQ